jgi:hypothetical protein
MENMDKKEGGCACSCSGGCGCDMRSMGGCMHMHGCHGGKRHAMRMLIKIVIVIIIFWCGFSIGQMIGFIKAETGRGLGGGFGMMRGYNYFNNNLPSGAGSGTVTPQTQ